VGSADADVVQSAVVAQGDAAGLVDLVVAQPVVAALVAAGRGGLGSGLVGLGGGAAGEGSVRSGGVVVLSPGVEQGLELGDGGRWWSAGEPLLEGLLDAFDFAAGLGMRGSGVLLRDVQAFELVLELVAAASVSGGEDQSVVGQDAGGDAVAGNGLPERGDDLRGGDGAVRCAGQDVAGVVVEKGQDFGVGAVGEADVGEVGLPGLIRQGGLEPVVGVPRGSMRSARCRIRQIVETDTVVSWWVLRCQARVWGPASSPALVSSPRSRRTRSTTGVGVARGFVRGRRDLGSKAASPSFR